MGHLTSMGLVSQYAEAIANQDYERMHALHSPDYVMDAITNDVFQSGPLTGEQVQNFWPAWFAGFTEINLHITRTIAAESVVVAQWTFTGVHSRTLRQIILGRDIEATGRVVHFRGVSVYDINQGAITRETMYLDLATLMVELGIDL